ncbi:MAG: tRNA (adenosine(37)-N6)-dimethylallyltransferase MiaA, partial [Clostridiales bacterium]|nr:tRNA (adenosine(37)-N6)-dimethylallyltransferase MiaA [Clostridiales bacterium]
PLEEYSVKRYVEDASRCIEDIKKRGRIPILCGGTGLYIDSLLKGRSFAASAEDATLRNELKRRAEEEGGAVLLSELQLFDPQSAARLHENDIKRIIRAIEVYKLSGKTMSEHNEISKKQPPRYRSLKLGLKFANRQELYDRIDLRVDQMVKKGLIDEARKLYKEGKLTGTALQAIGYKELIRLFRNECSEEEAVSDIKRESRRYAKRQMTWFSRDEEIHWVILSKMDSFENLFLNSMEYVKASGIK